MPEYERRPLPPWPFLGAFVIAVVAVLAVLLTGDPDTSLRIDRGASRGGDSQASAPAVPYLAGADALCVAHGKVSITGVELVDASQLRLVDWGVGDEGDPGDGSDAGSLVTQRRVSELTRPGAHGKRVPRFPHQPITGRCSPAGASDAYRGSAQHFVVSVVRTGSVGFASGIVVHSTSGSVTIHHTLALCEADCPEGILQSGTP